MRKSELKFEERRQVEKLIKECPDLSLTQISKLINRGKNTVIDEVRKNGGREVYNAELAHHRYLDLRAKKSQNVTLENHPIHRMKNKIDAIEMQLEIIIEELRALRNKNA